MLVFSNYAAFILKMSFKVRFSRSVVREGRCLQSRIKVLRDQRNQILYWSLDGKAVNRLDFSDGRIKGAIQIDSRGRGTITHLIRADGRQEGLEKARLSLFSAQSRRRRDRVAQASFSIRDSNRSSEPSPRKPGYSVALSKSEVAEGNSIRAQFNTTRRLRGANVFWELDGVGITRADFSNAGLNGAVKINRRGRAILRLDTSADNRLEGIENARLRLFSDRRRTDILTGSTFKILDTSKPSPPPQPSIPTQPPIDNPAPPPPPSTQPPSEDPTPPAPPPSTDNPQMVERLNIMPMGDSITLGFGSEEQSGYRQPLKDSLTGKPYTVNFVGRFGSDLKHWGRSGALISEDRDPITGETYVALRQGSESRLPFTNTLAPDIKDAISTTYFSRDITTKNVLLLTIGTNDFANQIVSSKYGGSTSGDINNDAMGEQQDKLGETIFQRLSSFLSRINTAAKNNSISLEILLGTIPTQVETPLNIRPASSITRSEIGQYNTLIKQNLNGSQAYSNLEIGVVDQFSAIGSNLSDGIHPTSQGYNAMATAWVKGIEANVLT